MPHIETWSRLPRAIRDHLMDRMRDRNISIEDLNQLRLWLESKPVVPEGPWDKDFGSLRLCGKGKSPKTFLLPGAATIRTRTLRYPAASALPTSRHTSERIKISEKESGT
jgi:hypothetical protein